MHAIGHERARARLFLVVAAAYAIVGVALPFSKISIDYGSFAADYALIAVLVVIAVCAARRGMARFAGTLDIVIAGSLAIAPITLATYLALSLDMPLADARLAAWDAALGFDWRAVVAWADAYRLLALTLGCAYWSFFLQIFVVPLIFAVKGETERAAAIVAAYILLCFISAAVAIWFPSVGAVAAYGVTQDALQNVSLQYGVQFLEQFYAVRDQSEFLFRRSELEGMVTFPSVHAGTALLCAWGAWKDRRVRYVFLALNVLMAAAALSHGGHYGVDILAGFGLAATAIAASRWFFGLAGARSSAGRLTGAALQPAA